MPDFTIILFYRQINNYDCKIELKDGLHRKWDVSNHID